MNVTHYTKQHAASIAHLLNEHLPFQPEDEQTVHEAGGVRFVALIEEQVVGYIAGYKIETFDEEFPYFKEELAPLRTQLTAESSMYVSHFVVNPTFRRRGIGSALVEAFMKEAEKQVDTIVVVGWVQSDTNAWAAEKQFMQHGFTKHTYIKHYFEPYDVYCPSCNGMCYCDANIVIKRKGDIK